MAFFNLESHPCRVGSAGAQEAARALAIPETKPTFEDLSQASANEPQGESVNSTKKTARIAGFLYLLSGVTAGVPLIYVPSTLIVPGNAAATANNILASERAFRACILSELIGAIVFLFMVRALYRLLNGVNKAQASLMVTLGLVPVPITFLNVLNDIAALTLVRGANFLSVFDSS